MKSVNSVLKTTILSAGLMLASSFSIAQWPETFGQGTINSSYCVTIDTANPLQEFYKIDFAHLNFAAEADAIKVFGAISNNLLTYKVDFANQVAYLKVHADRTKELQDVVWWNNYIDSLCHN